MNATFERIVKVANVSRATAMSQRDRVAVAFFGTWMLTGLYLDGWAHQADKPETFFTPWHGVLYSGFAAAIAFWSWTGFRERRRGVEQQNEPLVLIGFLIFGAGAVGDFIWHELFGIEVDLEALLSPTHLSLMIGGLLMLGGPIRSAWLDLEEAPNFRGFFPTLMTLTLCAALVTFFLLYLSPFNIEAEVFGGPSEDGLVTFLSQSHGISSILVTNAILLGAVIYAMRRWRPPFGSFTFLFGTVAFAQTGLEAFRNVELFIPAVVGGLAADILIARLSGSLDRRTTSLITGGVVPLVLWGSWFIVFHLSRGLGWTPELWIGAMLFASMTGLG
ncbi:MAG: hypothetical protein ACRD1T_15690, partial [Acidimicrobiia bacterium]